MAKINFLTLGGLDEKYKSLNILEIDSKLFILDSGIYEPLNNTYGIQSFIPRLDYLIENKDKIKGIFLSSAIYHQIGAIVNILKLFPDIKIYGSKFTLGTLNVFFPEIDFSKNLVYLKSGKEISISNVPIIPIELNSSLPGTFGYVFSSTDGNIFYFNNYAFDSLDEYNVPLLKDISNFIGKDNLLFISDSLNMDIESSVSPKYKITKYIRNYFSNKKRIIAFIYEEDFINIIELIKLSKIYNKKIYFYDQKIIDILNIAFKENVIGKYNQIYPLENLKNNHDPDAIVIISGNKTNLYKKVQSIIAENNDETFNFHHNDIILFAAEPIPGNEHIYQDITNGISRYNSLLVTPTKGEKVSIHPSRFDLKNYLSILKPKYFIPIRSYYQNLIEAKYLAIESGFDGKNVMIGDNGQIFEFNNKNYIGTTRKIKNVGQQIIESINDSEIHSEIIEDRKLLGKDGIVIISFVVDKQTKKIISNIDIQMRGVIFIKNQEHLIDRINDIINRNILDNAEKWNPNKINSSLNKEVLKLLRSEIKKTPIIILKIKENEK